MESWRISTILDNRSQKSLASSGAGIGATIAKTERSLETPVKFAKGETQRILNMLGEPTPSNPSLLEAIEYNKSYPLWLLSPSTYGYHAGLLLGTTGTEVLGDALLGTDSKDLSSITLYRVLTEAEGSSLQGFEGTVSHSDNYVDVSLKVYKNGELIEGLETVTGTPNTIENLEGETIVDEVSPSTFDAATGVVELNFVEGYVSTGDVISVSYDTDISDYYCLLEARGAGADYLKAKVVEGSEDGTFLLSYQIKNTQGNYVDAIDSTIEFSIIDGTTNGFGKNISINTVFDDHDFFVAHDTNGASFDSFTDDDSYTTITGGSRTLSDVDYTTGYNFFQSFRSYPVDVFFDATVSDSVPALFSTLRSSYQKYSRFILPMANQSVSATLEDTLTATNRGISYYWGWFKLLNLYSKKGNVIGIPMGEIAKKHADSIVLSFGGLAPAWTNENGVGGILTGGRVIESVYDPSEDELQSLDEARVNPVIYDPSFGPMIVSRRTSISELNDYSFIDYSGIADYVLKNITKNVLPYQLVKMNDPAHRNIVRTKTEAILEPMTVAPYNVISEYRVKCDSENNNDQIRQEEKFVLDVAVKVTPKARTIVFTFINTPQTATVEEMFE